MERNRIPWSSRDLIYRDPTQEKIFLANLNKWSNELSPILATLHRGSCPRSANSRSIPRLVLPAQHPPKFARLREDAHAEAVADQLAKLIDKGVKQYETVGDRDQPGQARGFPPCDHIESPLHWFLTAEVLRTIPGGDPGIKEAETLNKRFRTSL